MAPSVLNVETHNVLDEALAEKNLSYTFITTDERMKACPLLRRTKFTSNLPISFVLEVLLYEIVFNTSTVLFKADFISN